MKKVMFMVEIITLGNFSIKVNGTLVSISTGRTKKLWKLLSLLILNKDKPLTIQAIIDSIWPDEDVNISIKSMHNLIFRLRRVLSDGGSLPNPIVFSANGYILNREKDFVIDVHTMQDCCVKAANASSNEEKIAFLEKAAELYNGEYLLNSFDDLWSITAVNHYKRVFIDTVTALSELYLKKAAYEKLFQICEKATMLEPMEEAIYLRLLKGLVLTGQSVRAISLCEKYFDILYHEIGVRSSDQIYKLYSELKRNSVNFSRLEYEPVIALNEREVSDKAFFCSLETFKEIYKYELRQAERKETARGILAVISIKGKKYGLPPHELLQESKKHLYESCLNVLRKGDVFANYSHSQLIVLLADLKYKDHAEIMARIQKYFYKHYDYGEKEVLLDFEIQPIAADYFHCMEG